MSVEYELEIIGRNYTAIDLYTNDSIGAVLDAIKAETEKFTPDVSTSSGRKEIASMARKVASSKVVLDDTGKSLTEEWRKKTNKINEERKTAREFLDNLKDKVRAPLTQWEKEEERKAANKLHQAKFNNDAVSGLLVIGLSEGQAKDVVTAIARGDIPHVTINY